MEDLERRRFRDFVALAIPATWLSASPFLLVAFGADLPIAVGAAVFAATFVHAAYLARPRPMDQRVLRPIMIGSLLLAAATIAPRLIAFVTNDTYIDVGVSVSILIVTVLVVRSQVLKVIGSPPRPPHVGVWPIVTDHKIRANWEAPQGSPSCILSMGPSWRSSDSDFRPARWGFSQQKFWCWSCWSSHYPTYGFRKESTDMLGTGSREWGGANCSSSRGVCLDI